MDLYKEILIEVLQRHDANIYFPDLTITAKEVVETVSYRALKKIKEIIHDENLNDKECFGQIEEIITVLEEMGSNGGFRHDF